MLVCVSVGRTWNANILQCLLFFSWSFFLKVAVAVGSAIRKKATSRHRW